MRLFRLSTFLHKQIRKFHFTFLKNAEIKTQFQHISYEDFRLQSYLKSLTDQYLNNKSSISNLYDHQSLENIVSLAKEIELLSTESKELCAFIAGDSAIFFNRYIINNRIYFL